MRRFGGKTMVIAAACVVALFGAQAAWAIPSIEYDVVVAEDTLLAADMVSSGDTAERNWMASEIAVYLGIPESEVVLYYTKVWESTQGYETDWLQVVNDPAGTDLWAFDFGSTPEFFLVKVGAKKDENDHFLYLNVDSPFYGVIDLNDLGVVEITGVSHVGRGDGTPVPEPGTMFLLGSGLVGLGAWRRRRKAA